MAYDHSKKAGNIGDVWKHFILLEVLQALITRLPGNAAFRYFESHAGKSSYILPEKGEWQHGIGCLWPAVPSLASHVYFRLQGHNGGAGSLYRGSWNLVAGCLRYHETPFHLTLCDINDEIGHDIEEFRVKGKEMIDFRAVDGFAATASEAHTSDLVFLDPPYYPSDSDDDWQASMRTIAEVARHTTPYIVWYPLFDDAHPQALTDALISPAFEIHWGEHTNRRTGHMRGAGMLMHRDIASVVENNACHLKRLASLLGGVFRVRT